MAASPALAACSLIDGLVDVPILTEAGDARSKDAAAEEDCASDLESDSMNCGRCSHDCLGGKCAHGRCAPVVLAHGVREAWGLAVDSANVYFTSKVADTGYVMQCPLSGCATQVVLATNLDLPDRVAVDSKDVYWTVYGTGAGDGRIQACAIGGCGQKPTTLATGQDGPTGIAVESGRVYWTNAFGMSVCASGLGAGGSVTTLASHEANPFGVAADATGVYWVGGGEVRFCANGSCGETPTTLAAGQSNPYFISLYDGGIYWSDEVASGSVVTCAEARCGATLSTIAAAAQPGGVAADGTGVYWVTSLMSTGAVESCGPNGCGDGGPVTLAAGQAYPFSVAVDDKAVYWTDYVGEQVMKIAKP
jgi:hypothetical protein